MAVTHHRAAKTVIRAGTLPVAADGVDVRRHRSADQEQDWQNPVHPRFCFL
jgi:hypothetical protein